MSESAADYMTPAEVAELADVSRSTVTRWVREGYLPARRTPSRAGKGRIRILRSDVAALLNSEPAA